MNKLVLAVIGNFLISVILCILLFTVYHKYKESLNKKVVISSSSIVYFNLDKVIAEYDMANELKSSVSSKITIIQNELSKKGSDLQNRYNSYNDKLNKGLLSRHQVELLGNELQKAKDEFNVYANEKQEEISKMQQNLLKIIGESIKKFLDKYNKDKKYSLILSTQGDILPAPVSTGDSNLDITQDIIEKINDEYIKAKEKGLVVSLSPSSN